MHPLNPLNPLRIRCRPVRSSATPQAISCQPSAAAPSVSVRLSVSPKASAEDHPLPRADTWVRPYGAGSARAGSPRITKVSITSTYSGAATGMDRFARVKASPSVSARS